MESSAPLPSLLLLLLLTVAEWRLSAASGVNTITVGGLFDRYESDPALELAFRYGVEQASEALTIEHTVIAPRVERVQARSGFSTAKRVCHLLKEGVGAIVGPGAEPTSSHVRSVCDTKSVPHIDTTWRYQQRSESFAVNLYPYAETLSKTYVDVLETMHWKKFHVLYEDNDSLVRLQKVLRMMNPNNKIEMTVRQLPADKEYRQLLRQVQNAGGTHLVVDCSADNIHRVLKQAQQLGMVTRYYHFFFTNLNLHTVNLHDFQFAGTNITGLRLVRTGDLDVIRRVQSWKVAEALRGRQVTVTAGRLSTEAALMYDAALLFAKAIDDLHVSRDISVMPLNCDMDDLWPHGESVINYMRNVEVWGLTGLVRFDTVAGVRSSFSLDVVTLLDEGLVPLGTWSPDGFSLASGDGRARVVPSIRHQNLIVTTLIKKPYTMLKESSEELEGNDRYEGICVDLIEELSRALQFNYTINVTADNAPGKLDEKTGKWNGMIGELIGGRADLAIADLTITFEREAAVDFTMQFMNLGISILYRRPTREPPSLFSFLSPLSLRVWLYMAAATMGVSLLMFVLARFTPYEWEPPHPCAPDQDQLENNFNFLNCIWFCIGSLMQQGCDFLPKAVSTRMVAAIWWFFTLIMISSYTANLAAFLTVERMVSPITSVEDLAAQSSIKYGVYDAGSTGMFFKTSQIAPYNKMWQVMSQSPEVFLSTEEGIQRVKSDNGGFAYFMESPTIEYNVERDCELSQVGGLLDNKGFGIAVPRGSPWTDQLNEQLVYMQEQGQLARLKTKWWNSEEQCEDDGGSSTADELDLENVGGVFVCLMGGMVVATLIAIVEFVFHLRDQASGDNTSILSEMGRELRFILRCHGSTKPARGPPAAERRGSAGSALEPFNAAAARKHAAAYGGFQAPAVS